jgi:hypothetical protein
LDSDTQHDLQDLDRKVGLAFLTEPIIHALLLPTQVEGACWLWQHPGAGLLRELQQRGGNKIRLWSGVASELDLGRWRDSLTFGDLIRSGASVELIFPPGEVATLDANDAAFLRGLRDSVGWVIAEGAAPAGVWAEVVAEKSSWLCCQQLVGFHASWLENEGPWFLRPGGAASSEVVPATALERGQAGYIREVRIPANQLSVQVQNLGKTLLSILQASEPKITSYQGAACRIVVVDRYLRNPSSVKNLYSILGEFESRGWLADSTLLEVTTAAVKPQDPNMPKLAHHDWKDSSIQRQVIQELLGHFKVTVMVEPETQKVQHHRAIEIFWSDGRRLEIRLDHGLGFVKPAYIPQGVPFGFSLTPLKQASDLMVRYWRCESAFHGDALVYVGCE